MPSVAIATYRRRPTPNFEARSPVMGKRTKNTKSVSQKLPSLEPAQPSRDRNDQAQRAARLLGISDPREFSGEKQR
ncbi:conserved hypothetical protein [Coccidioides posadasii str. Silveira]|uniref:Uncharacterized protein n=2 Tax=Coccidioides posadasii TaxID=199306 RepID=E9DF72_COCPS|nr:conserved hypothetical protein [Coccidioides posadasii str. Silveira]KMM70635.1 hypothetical protein CPAG_06946 [Coccidioides posadasii RMSCC 3488]